MTSFLDISGNLVVVKCLSLGYNFLSINFRAITEFSSLSDLKSTSVNNKPRTIFRTWEVYISVVLLCNPGSLGWFFDAFLSAKLKWMRHIQLGRVLICDIHFCERGNGPHFELFWIPFFEFHEVSWICFGCWAAKASLVFTSDTVLSACA